MGFGIPTRTFQRLCLALLSVCSFGLSSTLACKDFRLKNVNDDGGDWKFYNFTDSKDCFLCFRRDNGNSHQTELVLPCSLQPVERRVQIFYKFWRARMSNSQHQGRVPLSVEGRKRRMCNDDYNSATNITHNISAGGQLSGLESEEPLMEYLHPMISYRLKIQSSMNNFPKDSIVCLTNVAFIETKMPFAATTSIPRATSDVKKTNQDQGQSNFPFWVIFVIIAILIISICAVAGIFIRRRKHHDHQPANNVNTEKVNGPTNGIKDNMKNDKDVIPNPTYGQEPVNEKEDEYHSYTEIDVKVSGNTEMIYNSAYESPPASSGMVYNSAYESEETNNDMIYNSAYGSSPSN